MLLGLQLGSYMPSTHGNHWDTTLAAARACEQAGLDSVWLPDHFMFPDKDDPSKEKPVFDCFVALAAIAASTSLITGFRSVRCTARSAGANPGWRSLAPR